MAKKGKANTATKRQKQAPRKKQRPQAASGMALADPRVRAWDQLLRDPCAASLAHPCYTGTDTGYLARTVDHYAVPAVTGTGFVAGSAVPIDVFFQWTPFNAASGAPGSGVLSAQALSTSGNLTMASSGPNNFITGSAVRRFRPIACCVKWIPSGPYASRQGTVGSGYSTGQIANVGNVFTTGALLSECMRIAPNGSECHEVRWLPTAVDENFTAVEVANNTGAGSTFFTLRGVDATATTTTSCTLNGYFEVTTAWEWVPEKATGLNVAPRAPLPYTTQQVLSTIGDIGAYVFEGLRTAGPGIMRATMQAGVQYLTRGVKQSYTRTGHLIAS